ncbi:MAG: CBS domain-containing protein, partial [Gammaproteobacteria bacterium]
MLDNLKVRDIYIPMENYPHIADTATICDAMKMMHSSQTEAHKYRTILVHDQDQHLIGYLSLRDLLRAVGPDYLKKAAPSIKGNQPFVGIPQDFSALALIWQEGFTVKISEEAQNTVAKYLTLFEHSVKLDDPFAK